MSKKAPPKPLDGDFIHLDYWHGLLPDEDTANLLKLEGEFLLRGVLRDDTYFVLLSIRWGTSVLNSAILQNNRGGYTLKDTSCDTVSEIIDLYQVRKRPLDIKNNKPILDTPVRRKEWELRQPMIKLGKELGAGSYGTVYLGMLSLERQKPIKPYYLVMELVNGGSLDRYLQKKTAKMALSERVKILLDGAKGMAYLHEKNCLHRDVAARNMLVGDVIKVADFGMSRRCNSYKVDTNKPLNLRWLAPEVFKKQEVNKSTDVYAFGVTMYEVFGNPYVIPYEDWAANKVYDEVVESGFRLAMHDHAPNYIKHLFQECIGPEENRPTFKTIVVCLTNFSEGKDQALGVGL